MTTLLCRRWFGIAVTAVTAVAAVAALTALTGRAAAQPRPSSEAQLRFNPAFAKNPPRVISSQLQDVDPAQWGGRNVMLEVDYDPADKRLGRQILVDFGEVRAVLRDDGQDGDAAPGDKRFTAVFAFDMSARETRRSDLLELVFQGVDSVPDFEGRELVGSHPLIDDVMAMSSGVVWTGVTAQSTGWDKSLMITDLSVVNDTSRTFNPCTGAGTANGPWTFSYLMNEFCKASGTPSVSNFTKDWLKTWATTQTVNGWPVSPRTHIGTILTNWPKLSNGDLDMTKAPFRLLAIVNRVDLRDSPTYGGSAGNAGEARFVFCLVNQTTCAPLQMTVIFEYQIRKSGCKNVKTWAQQWDALDGMAFGPTYNAALEAITHQFTDSGSDPTQLPNMSTLGQLRTNEVDQFTAGSLWELREFRLDASGNLAPVTVKQTPDTTLNQAAVVGKFVNSMPPATQSWPAVPNKYPASNNDFMGGSSIIKDAPGFPLTTPLGKNATWIGPATGPDVITAFDKRHKFSLNTCNGCHARETSTAFTHVSPRALLTQAGLSGFLTGITVVDPVDTTTSRTFNDMNRRLLDLNALVNNSCVDGLAFDTQSFASH